MSNSSWPRSPATATCRNSSSRAWAFGAARGPGGGGGDEGDRTPDLSSAIAALSHLSYVPVVPARRMAGHSEAPWAWQWPLGARRYPRRFPPTRGPFRRPLRFHDESLGFLPSSAGRGLAEIDWMACCGNRGHQPGRGPGRTSAERRARKRRRTDIHFVDRRGAGGRLPASTRGTEGQAVRSA